MSEDTQEVRIHTEPIEAKHKSIIDGMMKKTDEKLGDILAKRDMEPSLWVTDIVKTAGYLGIAYGVYTLITGEVTPSADSTPIHKVFNLLSGTSGIASGSVLVKAAEAASNPKNETAVKTDAAINNFYLAKAYVKDFLDHTKIKK